MKKLMILLLCLMFVVPLFSGVDYSSNTGARIMYNFLADFVNEESLGTSTMSVNTGQRVYQNYLIDFLMWADSVDNGLKALEVADLIVTDTLKAYIVIITADGDTLKINPYKELYIIDLEVNDSRIFGIDSTGKGLFVGTVTANSAILDGGTNTFSITNGTASLDVAAAATVNIDKSLTVDGQPVTITGVTQANTITLNESIIIGGGYSGTLTYSVASKVLTVEDSFTGGLDLNALEGLSSTGLLARTAANAYSERTITGTAYEVELANGNGVSGNPTISLPDSIYQNLYGGDSITVAVATIAKVDIGSGEIDGTPIGANSASTGAFSTISSTGQYTNTRADGTAPMVITSTTKVANLNVDKVDGVHLASLTDTRLMRYESTGTQIENATVTETSGALGGITTIGMSGQLTNSLAIGTSPFAITSTTVNTNLNADLLDAKSEAEFFDLSEDETVTGKTSFSDTLIASKAVKGDDGIMLSNETALKTTLPSDKSWTYPYDDGSNVHDVFTYDNAGTEANRFRASTQDVLNAGVGTSLYLDGVDDFVNLDLLAAELVNTSNTKGTIVWRGKISDFTTDYSTIWSFCNKSVNEYIYLLTSPTDYKFNMRCNYNNVAQWEFTTDNTFIENTEYTIILVQDGVEPKFYINGVLEPITFTEGGDNDKTFWFHELPGIDSGRLSSVNYLSGIDRAFGKNTVSYFNAWNYNWTAAEVKEFHLTGKYPFKYQGANMDIVATYDTSATQDVTITGMTYGWHYTWIQGTADSLMVGTAKATSDTTFVYASETVRANGGGAGDLTGSNLYHSGLIDAWLPRGISSDYWYAQYGHDGTISGAAVVNPPVSGLITNQEADTTAGGLVFEKSRSGGVITTADVVGSVIGKANDGTDFHTGVGKIDFVSSGTIGSNRTPGGIDFYYATDAGPSVLTKGMTLSNAGVFDVVGAFTAGSIVSDAGVSGTTGTFSGILSVDDVTESTSGTTGSIHTDGGLGVVKDIYVGDDILLADGAVVGITGNEVITFNAAGSINITGATFDVDGAATATSYTADADVTGVTVASITAANLLDKSANESISGIWTFTNEGGAIVVNDSAWVDTLTSTIGKFTKLSSTNYGSDNTVSDAELLYVGDVTSLIQAQLDARCLESVFGTAIGAGLTLDATTLKTHVALQSIAGLTETTNSLIYASGDNAYVVLAANATATNNYLRSVSSGVPSWGTLFAVDIPDISATTGAIGAGLVSIAGQTEADVSILEATADNAYNIVTSGGNNYILGSNAGNTALEFKAPTGSGAPVLATSPTLVTPILGVAAATTMTLTLNVVALTDGLPTDTEIDAGTGTTPGAVASGWTTYLEDNSDGVIYQVMSDGVDSWYYFTGTLAINP